MAIEIEKKYRLDDRRRAEITALLKTTATYVREDFEENIIFGGGDLAKKFAVLRLRRIGGKTILTYKERIASDSDIKHQIEHETEVVDFDAAFKIFESLGFKPSLIYEKSREVWQLNDAEIVLDELPFGLYIEIEGTVEAIREIEKLLAIGDLESVEETYPQLTIKYGDEINGIVEARFKK